MIIFYLLILSLILYKIRWKGITQSEYLSFNTTNSVKGVFILLVFMRHVIPYIENQPQGTLDQLGYSFDAWFEQLIVVMFLFYSGYGVMLGIIKKGKKYVISIPKHRVLQTMLNFDLAVVLFVILSIILKRNLHLLDILLAFTGWTEIGNSNWYIFDIVICYLVTYISFRFFKKDSIAVIFLCLTILAISILFSRVKESWWYDTIYSYPAGILYARHKERIEGWINQRKWIIPLALVISTAICFLLAHIYKSSFHPFFLSANLRGLFFVVMVLCLTQIFTIGNPILAWLGKNLFPLYIYQRIAMITLSSIAGGYLVHQQPYLYIALSFIFSLPFVPYFKKIEVKL